MNPKNQTILFTTAKWERQERKNPTVRERIRHGPCTLPVMTHLLVLPVIYDSEKLSYDCSEPQIDARKCFETLP